MEFKIGELARQTGLTIRTLRHYDALGLLRPSGRTQAAYRLYSPADLTRLLHIQGLKTLGLTLPEIARALDDPAYDAQESFRQHIEVLETRIAQERQLVSRLHALQGAAEVSWTAVMETIALTQRVAQQVGHFMQAAQDVAGHLTLSDEQVQCFQNQSWDSGDDDWETLLTHVFTALEEGLPSTSPEAGMLATRWQQLIGRTTADRPEIAQAIGRAYEHHLPADLRTAWTFISEAMSSQHASATMTNPSAVTDLSHPDKNVRIRAALDLGAAQHRDALPDLIARLGHEADFFVRENLTWAIVRMGPEAVPPLLELLENPDAATRLQAVHTLGKLADAASTAALSRAVNDPDDGVARKAIFALGQMGHGSALSPLIAGLGHADPERRNTLSTALVEFGGVALPALLKTLQDPEAQRRTHAADILGLLGDPVAAPALTEALRDDSWEVQFAALSALGHLPGEDAEQGIVQATQLVDPRLRAVAQRLTANRLEPSNALQARLKQRREQGKRDRAAGRV
ncbi:HEAT repeat domain-containing protein (plasmid) [Deinococcus sp. KNUC1210]|uniref:HEAT repeat domain-containing protein n=1 Tax=Deinococcus sp. KNUC1210 TaxID=2917691 RepID=UPI001EF00D3F|nr:HEAT repeat domain-containing protein [Deinococcus sp. KNUC1210]ULH18210.1 HEAT repeat domain-containing protein [Deinococcus sp. KNUC1210]